MGAASSLGLSAETLAAVKSLPDAAQSELGAVIAERGLGLCKPTEASAKKTAAVAEASAELGYDGSAAKRLLLAMEGYAERPPHFGAEALLDSVASGAILPLRGTYVVQLEASGGILSCRQELPPEAFWSASELRVLVEALGDDYALLFVALSYR